jgi:hypothetical protein
MRVLQMADFEYALTKTRKSDTAATDYASELIVESREEAQLIVRKVMETLQGVAESGKDSGDVECDPIDTDEMD